MPWRRRLAGAASQGRRDLLTQQVAQVFAVMRDPEFGSCDLRFARTATHPDYLSASSSPYGWDFPSPASWPHQMTAAQASISSTAIRAAEGQPLVKP
jgi:hypothetical protein